MKSRSRLTVMERIVGEMELDPVNGCWLFTGPKDENGYGRIKVNGRMQRTHRLMYEMHRGPIPNGKVLCHDCDTPACCHPWHVFPGTQTENIADAKQKMRMRGRGAWMTCMRGHPWTPENTIIQANGAKTCRTCRRASSKRSEERRRRNRGR